MEKPNMKPLMALYFCFHLFMTPQIGYLSLYLSNNGITDAQIGTIFAVAPLTAILGQFFWSNRADKSKSINSVLYIIISIAMIFVASFLLADNYIAFLVLIVAQYFFFNPIAPMVDSLTLNFCVQNNAKYGNMRLMGSIGYLICMLICGFISGYWLKSIFIMQLIGGSCLLIAVSRVPKVSVPKLKKKFFNPLPILKRREVFLSLFFGLFLFFCINVHTTFYGPYLVNTLGLPNYVIGFCSVTSIAVEVTFLLKYNWIAEHIKIRHIVLLNGILTMIRWGVYGMTTNAVIYVLFAAFDGITSISFGIVMAFYFAKISPGEGRVSLQMTISILTTSLGKILGNFFGPILMAAVGGLQNSYKVMSIIMMVITIVYFIVPSKFEGDDEKCIRQQS